MRNDEYDFKEYGKLVDFGNKLYNKKLSLAEAKNEQDKLLDSIHSLEKSVDKDKTGRPFSDEKKKKINYTVKYLEKIYKTRGGIIDVFEGAEYEQKQTKEPNFDLLIGSKEGLENLLKDAETVKKKLPLIKEIKKIGLINLKKQ